MRAIQVSTYVPGPSALTVTTQPDPIPNPDQYLIAIEATACNFFDLLQIRGKYQHQPPLPWISGSEFSGRILAVPSSPPTSTSGRHKYAVGDRVFGAAQGGYATRICAAETQLLPVPRGWSSQEAAGLFVTMPTAYAGLVLRGQVKKGEWVLVHAGAGGVGLAGVQVARALGARVVVTAGSEGKVEVGKRFGAEAGVVYDKEGRWTERVKEVTGGRGVDVVFDPVGLVNLSLKCLRWNGRVVVVGFAGGEIEKVAANRLLLKNVSVTGLHWGAYAKNEPEAQGVVWEGLFGMFERGEVRGTNFTDKEFVGLESVPEALEMLGARGTWGKVVVKVPQEGESKL